MSAEYVVPARAISVEIEIKKSRFITFLAPTQSRQEALTFVQEKRLEYPDASHHCSAFVISPGVAGFDDDGEPTGTAGRPMLNVLQHKHIHHIVAVVVRYFGGIKLGAGGLVRAYSASVQEACAKLPLEKRVELRNGLLICDYAHEQMVRHYLEQYRATLQRCDYGQTVTMLICIPETTSDKLAHQLYEISRGQITIRWHSP